MAEAREPSGIAMLWFFAFIATTLGITYWAARRTRSTEQFYAAGRSITAGQNGFALAGDYMSAASFLGIAGLVSTTGFDGLIYSTGWLVGWPIVLFLIAEPLRNLGRFTFADVVALRMRQVPVRIAAACGTLATVSFYLIAQMVGAGSLIKLLFGLSYETAVALTGAAMITYVLFGGMLATTWVQIVKAGLLLSGATLLAGLVLARFDFNPAALFAAAAAQYGDAVLAPGLSLHHLGGHTDGLQVVRVDTGDRTVVVASDATHYYENIETGRPFPIVYDVGAMLDGFDTLRRLAGPGGVVVPGHHARTPPTGIAASQRGSSQERTGAGS